MTILEKIRAEIEQNAYPIVHGVNNHEKGMTLYGILQILDKYAEQEPKTGHWEEIVTEHKCYARDDTYTTTEYHCSECGAEPFANEDGYYEFSNYCPNCGAKMVDMRKESE